MTVSFLTTYRRSDEYRLANLEKVIDRIASDFPGWQIVVVEQDEKSTLDAHPLLEKVTYLHAYNPGPFNKSWGMNVAFKQSEGDILVISDADMIVSKDHLLRTIAACEKELDAVRPYAHLIDMTAAETEVYMQQNTLPEAPATERGFDRAHAKELLCMAGGIYVISRDFFERVGGMDERFAGWGGEDNAMSIKLQRMSPRVAIARNAIGWHLWHPRLQRYNHDGYQLNQDLLQHYQQLSKNEMSWMCREQYPGIGDIDKYHVSKQKVSQSLQVSETGQDFFTYPQLFPEEYGEIQLSGPKVSARKFGIVITSCCRSEYLKQCLASLAGSDLSQAVLCIVDETEARKIEVDGFTCYEGVDYPELDIRQVGNNIDSILHVLERESSCNLFNEQGWIKKNIQSPSRLTIMHPRHGLYVRNSYLDENADIKEFLHEMKSKKDTEAADIIRQFSINRVPVIKVFKSIHRNMYDSLRSGWDYLSELGCEYLVNLDADTIVEYDWLTKLEETYEHYSNDKPDSSFIVTGFNTEKHTVFYRTERYALKKTVGGVNLFFDNKTYSKYVRPVLSSVAWDDLLSAKLARNNASIVATTSSVVQHIGEFGLWSRPWRFDVADDFGE